MDVCHVKALKSRLSLLMAIEFTGERVVPGHVDSDLWNEHYARYAFASRLCKNRRVLDAGSGTGYGTAELSASADLVIGMDVSAEAVAYATDNYVRDNVRWLQGSCASLPFRSGAFDVVVAFEVIEHLPDWSAFIREARRVLTPAGQFIVSTPNKSFYGESRQQSGPNPYHEHEFDYGEFRAALLEVFPVAAFFVEDHTEGILFRSIDSRPSAELLLEASDHNPSDSNFFVAVCGLSRAPEARTFVYIPRTANLLKERGIHITRLQNELTTKDEWLRTAQAEHRRLVELHRDQTAELEKSNQWAKDLDLRLTAAGERIGQLQTELTEQETACRSMAESLIEVKSELERSNVWGQRITEDLQHQTSELARSVELLDKAEATVEERTRWALQLQEERGALEAALASAQSSRWVRLGRLLGVGPELNKAWLNKA